MVRNDNEKIEASIDLASMSDAKEKVAVRKKTREIAAGQNLLIVIGFMLVGFFVGQFIAGAVAIGLAAANGAELGATSHFLLSVKRTNCSIPGRI